jgi:hypothetical protein
MLIRSGIPNPKMNADDGMASESLVSEIKKHLQDHDSYETSRFAWDPVFTPASRFAGERLAKAGYVIDWSNDGVDFIAKRREA